MHLPAKMIYPEKNSDKLGLPLPYQLNNIIGEKNKQPKENKSSQKN